MRALYILACDICSYVQKCTLCIPLKLTVNRIQTNYFYKFYLVFK